MMPTMKRAAAIMLGVAAVGLSASAWTVHRSFTHRDVGIGFSTGAATVSVPIDRKMAKALDEAHDDEVARCRERAMKTKRTKKTHMLVVGEGSNANSRVTAPKPYRERIFWTTNSVNR